VVEDNATNEYTNVGDEMAAIGLGRDYAARLEIDLYRRYSWLNARLETGAAGVGIADPDNPVDFTDLDNDLSPAGEFVDFAALPPGINPVRNYRDNNFDSLIIDNEGQAPYRLDATLPTRVAGLFRGIILCTGDLIIDDEMDVSGMVVAAGKIYVEGDGVISSDTGAVQAILDEEMRNASQAADPANIELTNVAQYLRDVRINTTGQDFTRRITGTDYTDYISYDDWHRGEVPD
jgi:hypothetical protein